MVHRTLSRSLPVWLGIVGVLSLAVGHEALGDAFDDARALWKTGKYAESKEAFDSALKDVDNPDARTKARHALGISACLESQGEYDKAREAVESALADQQENADLLAALAENQFNRGMWEEAQVGVDRALKADPDHLRALWVQAQLFEGKGQRDEAVKVYEGMMDYQNNHPVEVGRDAEALVLIGQAAERYYRARATGEDLANGLNEVINTVYESALRVDPKCWQAAWLEGRLFLSGYQERSGLRELTRALRINPNAAEVITTLGEADLEGYKLAAGRKRVEDALEINPRYGPAMVLLADLNISDERFKEALDASKKAVAENPRDLAALGRLAASYRLLVDPVGMAAAEATARAINPKPSVFYTAQGERLSDRRKYHSAERAYLRAIEADPGNFEARIGLGMLYMQIGREDEANDLFVAAFDADPFNVRAKNMMLVLRHMANYESIETPHYSVLVLADQDALLGKYLSRFLEKSHDSLVERFGFEPPGRTKIEIMKDHEWFSGRTTGQPFIPTVGACTGKVVALASPRTTRKPFNWARVMIHEVTHVITLQQTEFNIPHWYTEALAVESEASPRPQSWNKMLQERIPARKLLNLDNINLGFIRPKEPEERQLAYCQAQLYAQYMVKRFGPDAQIKLLNAYQSGLTTEPAIKLCFGVEKADFEKGYLEFLDSVLKTIRTRVADEEEVTFSKLEQQLKARPEDADLNARMAYEHFARRDLKAARPFADKALKLKEHHPLASYVKARLFVTIGDRSTALDILRPALDEKQPNERVVDLLAELEMKEGNLDEAERLYELARQDDPYHSKWIAGLARVHLRQEDRAGLLNDLAMLAANDADDLDVRKTLATYHLKDKNFDEAEKWGYECLYIQVYDPALHVILADALLGQDKFDEATDEYETAIGLRPKRPNEIRLKLAQAQIGADKKDDARATLEKILKSEPDNDEAKELIKTIEK